MPVKAFWTPPRERALKFHFKVFFQLDPLRRPGVNPASEKNMEEEISRRFKCSFSEDRVYCFICHRELNEEMFVLVMNSDDEMICLCRDHMDHLASRIAGGALNHIDHFQIP